MQHPSRITVGDTDIALAERTVALVRRELTHAINDHETAPILAAIVERLGQAEGELQAFTDCLTYVERHGHTEALIRLTESTFDPVLLHDVRRDGYKRAVSQIFRGTHMNSALTKVEA